MKSWKKSVWNSESVNRMTRENRHAVHSKTLTYQDSLGLDVVARLVLGQIANAGHDFALSEVFNEIYHANS